MTEKMGWCLSNQHAGDPAVPEYQRCPGQQWNLICPCECHDKHPPKVPIPPPMKQRPKLTVEAAPRQAGKTTRQRRKLL